MTNEELREELEHIFPQMQDAVNDMYECLISLKYVAQNSGMADMKAVCSSLLDTIDGSRSDSLVSKLDALVGEKISTDI